MTGVSALRVPPGERAGFSLSAEPLSLWLSLLSLGLFGSFSFRSLALLLLLGRGDSRLASPSLASLADFSLRLSERRGPRVTLGDRPGRGSSSELWQGSIWEETKKSRELGNLPPAN